MYPVVSVNLPVADSGRHPGLGGRVIVRPWDKARMSWSQLVQAGLSN